MLLAAGGLDSFVQFITVLIIFILVFAVTIWVTKWMGKYQKGQMAAHNMAVVDSMRLTQSQCIHIVRIGNKYSAIAVSKDSITKIMDLDESDIVFDAEQTGTESFSDIFNKMKSSLPIKSKTDETLHDDEDTNKN